MTALEGSKEVPKIRDRINGMLSLARAVKGDAKESRMGCVVLLRKAIAQFGELDDLLERLGVTTLRGTQEGD